jgi:hypothetical protein
MSVPDDQLEELLRKITDFQAKLNEIASRMMEDAAQSHPQDAGNRVSCSTSKRPMFRRDS